MENNKHWEAREIKLGNVKVGKQIVVVFKTLSDLPSIAEISADCGCTKGNCNVNCRLPVIR